MARCHDDINDDGKATKEVYRKEGRRVARNTEPPKAIRRGIIVGAPRSHHMSHPIPSTPS
jgi:hypothetical protein